MVSGGTEVPRQENFRLRNLTEKLQAEVRNPTISADMLTAVQLPLNPARIVGGALWFVTVLENRSICPHQLDSLLKVSRLQGEQVGRLQGEQVTGRAG